MQSNATSIAKPQNIPSICVVVAFFSPLQSCSCFPVCIFGLCLCVLGEWEFIGLSVCRGSHRCECHVTEVKKGKVRVFSCLLRSLYERGVCWKDTKHQCRYSEPSNEHLATQP